MAGVIPRLWIRQITNFILAYHDRGRFKEIKIQEVREDVCI